MRGKLPLDDAVQNLGIQLASKRVCCSQSRGESIHHVLVSNEIARTVWNHLEGIFGIASSNQLLQFKINSWWIQKANSPCFKEILSFVPVCICWKMWRNRCRGRADGVIWSASQVISSVIGEIRDAFAGNQLLAAAHVNEVRKFRAFGLCVGGAVMRTCIFIKCEKPDVDRCKLNPGPSGGGSLLRNHKGHVLLALADFYGQQSNMVAEARALLQGLQCCLEMGFVHVDVEINSLILVKILRREVDT